MNKNEIYKQVEETLNKAINKWPKWVEISDAINVIQEEVGELTRAINQFNYENGDKEEIKKEALQSLAMLIRFLIYFDEYKPKTRYI